MREITFEEINDENLRVEIFSSEIQPLLEQASKNSIKEMIDGLEMPFYVETGDLIGNAINNQKILNILKELSIESIFYCEKIFRFFNNCFLFRDENIRLVIFEIVKSCLKKNEIRPFKLIYKVSVNPAPIKLFEDIYKTLTVEEKNQVVLIYNDFLEIKKELDQREYDFDKKFQSEGKKNINPIKQLTRDDVITGWQAYDSDADELTAFIESTPAARLAHDAAVQAMNEGDEKGRSTWEGFLRALYIVSVKLDAF